MLLRQIEYLQAVIENGNFYEAAEQCHVSQSAISQQIKKLEDELGVQLLERHNRTFSLTAAGEHFYRKSLIITGDIGQMIRETKRIAANNNVILKIGYYKGYHGMGMNCRKRLLCFQKNILLLMCRLLSVATKNSTMLWKTELLISP